jgi:DNA-binding PadR family transcriptional regulator
MVDGPYNAEAELGMSYGNMITLEDRRVADEAEYERLTRRLYELTEEWERVEQERRELERQLVADELHGEGGLRPWAALGHVERRLRI